MADVPKFPGFPGQPGERWAFIKNIPSFFGGEDAEVDTSILPFDLGDKRFMAESNEPFMPPDLTTVEPTDKYSQLERDWQNLQKIPEGTRDIFNRIVSEGEPSNIWPVQELFPHIEPRSSNPIRSVNPLTSPPRNLTVEKMIRAIEPGMRGPSGPPPTRIPSWRPFLRGGPLALGVASSLFSPRAEAPMKTPRRVYEDVTNPLHMSPVHFTDEDSPFRKQLPHSLFPPGYLRERAGRNAVEGVRQNLLGNLGLLPSTTSGALTPQELFKQRNDAEELRLREGSIPETSIWNPISAAGASTTPVSPDVIFNPPQQYLQSVEQSGALGKDITPKFLGIPSRYHMREYLGATGPEPDTTGDPRVWYTEPVPEWTPPAPVIPDIVVPPPARDEPEAQVEDFSAIRKADRSRQERERQAEVRKAASAARKKEAKREAATKKKAAEQRAKLDSASKKALEEHMAWMETQTKRVAKEEEKRAKRYAGGRGGALMYT
jgi:hypothetical protein